MGKAKRDEKWSLTTLLPRLLYTEPPKFNIEPENDSFQEESSFFRGLFSGSIWNFRSVIWVYYWILNTGEIASPKGSWSKLLWESVGGFIWVMLMVCLKIFVQPKPWNCLKLFEVTWKVQSLFQIFPHEFPESGTSPARFSGRCFLSTSPSVRFVQQLHLEYHGNWCYAVVVTWQKPRSLEPSWWTIWYDFWWEKKMGWYIYIFIYM